jgi:hypothetical protein
VHDGKDTTFLLVFVDAKKVKQQEDVDAGLLQSNIWATLFRGGFTNTGKLQRSLSGHHVSPRILFSFDVVDHSKLRRAYSFLGGHFHNI